MSNIDIEFHTGVSKEKAHSSLKTFSPGQGTLMEAKCGLKSSDMLLDASIFHLYLIQKMLTAILSAEKKNLKLVLSSARVGNVVTAAQHIPNTN